MRTLTDAAMELQNDVLFAELVDSLSLRGDLLAV